MYLDKCVYKTASLFSLSLKAAAIIAVEAGKSDSDNDDEEALASMAYAYGHDLGIAFQLVDDWLDFTAKSEHLGKPTATDLK